MDGKFWKWYFYGSYNMNVSFSGVEQSFTLAKCSGESQTSDTRNQGQ